MCLYFRTFARFIYMMMRGEPRLEKVRPRVVEAPPIVHIPMDPTLSGNGHEEEEEQSSAPSKIEVFGMDVMREEGEGGEVQ